jgi:Glycosyl transferase family 2
VTAPKISVILPVYNGAKDVAKAVQSILAQDLKDFELIAINDGSKDDSASVLNSFSDSRIRVFHQDNIGLAATLNRALSLASSDLIARQDQDDLSQSKRLSAQWQFMTEHSECGLLGTAAEIWVEDSPSGRAHDHPTDHASLRFELLFNNPFVHSSVVMRRGLVLGLGGYTVDPARQPPEDYELWSRIARSAKIANLSERLLVYREVPNSMSRTGPNPFLDRLILLSSENIAYACGLPLRDTVTDDMAALTHSGFHRLSSRPDISLMIKYLNTAARGIAGDDQTVAGRLATHSHRLEYQWLMHKGNLGWLRSALSSLRKRWA